MAKHHKTIKELEDESGKKDSIRGLNGHNVRGDKQVRNLVKEFEQLLPDLTLPEIMPNDIVVRYPDGSVKWLTGTDLTTASALLNFAGLLDK